MYYTIGFATIAFGASSIYCRLTKQSTRGSYFMSASEGIILVCTVTAGLIGFGYGLSAMSNGQHPIQSLILAIPSKISS